MLQGHGDGGPAHAPKTRDWSTEAERMRAGDPDAVPGTEARPTPLPKVNFTLLGLGPGASRSSLPAPPPLPGALSPALFEARELVPSDAELDALLRQVDANLDQTLELDARPVRPPWLRRRRRRTIWAGLALYLAVGSASFLWFAERSKRSVPAQVPLPSEAAMVAAAPSEELSAARVPGAQPEARPASAAPPNLRKAERRAVVSKKAKRAKLLAARAKRKKRARAAQSL